MAAQVLQALVAPAVATCAMPRATASLPRLPTLPDGRSGRTIEQHIHDRLPGVVIEPWKYQLDGSMTAKTAAGEACQQQSSRTCATGPPEVTVNEIAADLELTDREKRALKDS